MDDAENAKPIKFQDDLTNPVEIPGVDTAQQTIEINDLDISLYSLPTLTYFEVDLLSWSTRWHPNS